MKKRMAAVLTLLAVSSVLLPSTASAQGGAVIRGSGTVYTANGTTFGGPAVIEGAVIGREALFVDMQTVAPVTSGSCEPILWGGAVLQAMHGQTAGSLEGDVQLAGSVCATSGGYVFSGTYTLQTGDPHPTLENGAGTATISFSGTTYTIQMVGNFS